jgi:hypothetical protein
MGAWVSEGQKGYRQRMGTTPHLALKHEPDEATSLEHKARIAMQAGS